MVFTSGMLSYRLDVEDGNIDWSMELSKIDFVKLMRGSESFDSLFAASRMKFSGDRNAVLMILSSMDKANLDFSIVLP